MTKGQDIGQLENLTPMTRQWMQLLHSARQIRPSLLSILLTYMHSLPLFIKIEIELNAQSFQFGIRLKDQLILTFLRQ